MLEAEPSGQQEAIEAYMLEEATARQTKDNYKSAQRNEWSNSKAGSFLVRSIMNAQQTEEHMSFVASVSKFMDITARKGAGKYMTGAKLLYETGLEPEQVAYLATKSIFNRSAFSGSSKSIKRSSLAMWVGDLVHDEWRVAVFSSDERRKALLKKLMKDFDKRTYPREWRKRTIKNYFDAEQIDWSGWTPRQKLVVGMSLIWLFKEATGLIEFSSDGTYVNLTDQAVTYIQELVKKQTSLFTLYLPMVVPPRPWGDKNLFQGGYMSKKIRRYPFIKGTGRRDVERLTGLDLSKVYPAVNALQETPWRINKEMLEATKWAYWEYTKSPQCPTNGLGKLPRCDKEDLPELPEAYYSDEAVKKEHNHTVFLIHDRNRRSKSKRIFVSVALELAQRYAEHPAIYFPHNLDSRGRAYPITGFLTPQGPDWCKALLEFSRGEPVATPEAERWLAIAGANSFGIDKVSLDERVQWVRDNKELILGCADNYRTDHRWMSASEPFQFLRFCFEWRDYLREGMGYVSHMVIPVDATCSGLQHYAAMLRDEIGGRSVNLIPGLSRQDIYGDVASVVRDGLTRESGPLAEHGLAFGIDRKMTKRQVMVVPYAGKFSSCLKYTEEAVLEKLEAGYAAGWDIRDHAVHQEHLVYLARHIWNAIDQVVVKGKQAMNWLSKLAGDYAKEANKRGVCEGMSWVTTDGFQVIHMREEEKLHRVNTFLDGRIRLSVYEGTGRLSPKEMALAVAPNFVHSYDATHLRLTIRQALELGITTDFGMVHDSFGVHAAHMSRFLSECVKPTFVTMYQTDVLQELYDQYSKQIPDLPTPPEKGSLDLNGVLSSEFFFS